MDEWTVDLFSLMAENGLWAIFSDEEKASLGFEEEKITRWFLTVAICATTRCILAMKLSRAPSARSAMQTIDMIVRDKGVFADAVGTQYPWNMSGTPELIVTDCGSAFINFDTRAGASDLGIHIDAGPAGMPELRARIERMFGTMSTRLISRFTGRTFSNTIQKGDYDGEARAALTTEDLSEALVRWVVDVYHRTPHAGLGGETPANCWKRLVARSGVAPMPSVRMRRKALGTRLERTVTKTGITVLGIRYHSEVLAQWFMHSNSRQVRVRWYSEDLGAIAVELDGKWIEVPSVFERFQGERAQTWLMAMREIRASVAALKAVDEMVIFNAMARIREIKAQAMARIGLMVDDYSAGRIKSLEDGMLIGFHVDEAPRRAQQLSEADDMGIELPTSQNPVARSASAVTTPTDAPPDASEADDDPWSFDEK
jgi:putative transposase